MASQGGWGQVAGPGSETAGGRGGGGSLPHPCGSEPRAQLERAGPIGVGAWDRQTPEEGKREFTLCGECVVEVFLGWAVLSITLKPLLVGKREEMVQDDLGGQLAHPAEEEVAPGPEPTATPLPPATSPLSLQNDLKGRLIEEKE